MKAMKTKTLNTACTILVFIGMTATVISQESSTDFLEGNSSEMQNMVSFTAQYIEGKAYLNWNVTDTCGKCVYYVERSEDGINFETIAIKKGLPSPGDKKLSYSFIDKYPKIVYSFYRIKRVGENEEISFSWVEIIYNDNSLQTLSNDLASTDILPIK